MCRPQTLDLVAELAPEMSEAEMACWKELRDRGNDARRLAKRVAEVPIRVFAFRRGVQRPHQPASMFFLQIKLGLKSLPEMEAPAAAKSPAKQEEDMKRKAKHDDMKRTLTAE